MLGLGGCGESVLPASILRILRTFKPALAASSSCVKPNRRRLARTTSPNTPPRHALFRPIDP